MLGGAGLEQRDPARLARRASVRLMRRHVGIAALASALALGAVLAGATAPSALASEGPGEEARERTESARAPFRVTRVTGGLRDALYVTGAPGEASRLFVVRQSGTVRILQRGRLTGRLFLNVSGLVRSGGEQGLLGLAFHPGYARNGRIFVNYTDRGGDTVVAEYRRAGRNRVNPSSARVLLRIAQPFSNHNGGHLAFGPDGMLYIAVGDGGSSGDPGRNAQDRGSLLGKILRIDVDSRTGGRPYGIPSGNPFASGGGRPEVYAYGLRNPWRFSFDRKRGDLWIGDVGQNRVEEIDFARKGRGAGLNFGWNAFEGRSAFAGAGALQGRAPTRPVAQYTHARGCSVTGGYVYRGSRAPALRGRYLYADYCTGELWSMRAGPRPGTPRRETGRLNVRLRTVTSFGESTGGDLYVISGGALYRFTR